MLTCKKPEQKAAFDTDKQLNVVFHTNMRYKIIFDNLIYCTIHANTQRDHRKPNC